MRKNKNIVKVNEYLQMGQYAQEYQCSNCGTKGKIILNETDCCKYTCRNCGYQGDFEQEISDQNDVESEWLSSYTEAEKEEVYDGDCQEWY